MTQPSAHPDDPHYLMRSGWLRAAVLGANDGIVSMAGLLIGVAGAAAGREALLTAGAAGLAAGAMSMAVGEYVSVSAQRDSEHAMLDLERRELAELPEEELRELEGILSQDVGVPLHEGAGIEQLPDALPGAKAEVIRALGANAVGALKLPTVDQLAATRAFDPEVFRYMVLGAVVVLVLFRTKLSPALEEIPHRRHGAPCRSTFAGTGDQMMGRSNERGYGSGDGGTRACARPLHRALVRGAGRHGCMLPLRTASFRQARQQQHETGADNAEDHVDGQGAVVPAE